MKKILFFLLLVLQIGIIPAQKKFSFVFLPDIHLQNNPEDIANFENVARQINKLHPDFILTGGDMIYTAKNVNDKKAEALFNLMDREFRLFKAPVRMAMGNHENVGITGESGIDSSNPMWGKRMYEKRYGNRYYSFPFQNWKFFILDGILIREKKRDYTQGVDPVQVDWLKQELQNTPDNQPIVLFIHTPLINPHAMTDHLSQALSGDSEAILKLFGEHNLKIVLQGHNHIYMNLFTDGIYYLSGGSTAYGTGKNDFGIPLITLCKDEVKIKFIPLQSKELI